MAPNVVTFCGRALVSRTHHPKYSIISFTLATHLEPSRIGGPVPWADHNVRLKRVLLLKGNGRKEWSPNTCSWPDLDRYGVRLANESVYIDMVGMYLGF